MRVLLPISAAGATGSGVAENVDVHEHYAHDWIGHGGLRANFVSSVDGAATVAGLSRGLQTPGDNRVFAALRDLADVVLVGASTAHAEHYRPADPSPERRATRQRFGLAAVPSVAVLSSSLNLDLTEELFAKARPEAPTLIITSSAAPIDRRNDVIDAAASGMAIQLLETPADDIGGVNMHAAVTHLNDMGFRHLLFEGGPRAFGSAVRDRALTELCLSVSPMLVGPSGPRISEGEPWPPDGLAALELTGLLLEDHALFCRYTVR